MKTNDLKKGAEILLEDGTTGTMEDNKKGNIRTMSLDNPFGSRNLGDQYTWKIIAHRNPEGGWSRDIEHTPAQLKCHKAVDAFDSMLRGC
jgi:hypothetical protein